MGAIAFTDLLVTITVDEPKISGVITATGNGEAAGGGSSARTSIPEHVGGAITPFFSNANRTA